MNKKVSIMSLGILIVIAIVLGVLLVNKGDGPVMGMILSGKAVGSIGEYDAVQKQHGDGVFLVVANEFNKYQEKYKAAIPAGKDLYACVHVVECPKGAEFTGKWKYGGNTLKEEIVALSTDKSGVLSFLLESGNVKSGNYTFELYDGDNKRFELGFTVE